MNSLPIGIIFGLIAFTACGFSDFFATYSTRNVGSVKTFFWSQFASLIFYTFFFLFFFLTIPSISYSEWLLIILMTIAVIGGFFNYYKGFKVGKVAVIAPIVNSWPIITLFFALTILGQSLKISQAYAIIIILFGALLVSFKYSDLKRFVFKNAASGLRYAIIGAFMFGVAYTILDPLVASLGFFIPVFLHKLIQVPLSYTYIKNKKIDLKFPKSIVFFIVLIGGLEFGGVITYNLAINSEFTALIAPMMAASPMVTVLLARIFFKERLNLNQWLGVFLIVSGIALLST